jgi:dienelactone hydrolase
MKLSPTLAGLIIFAAGAFAAIADDDGALPGAKPLTIEGDLSALMHEAALRDMDRKIADSIVSRPRFWHRDTSSPEAYEKSIEANREHFRKIIGVVDQRLPATMEYFGDAENPALVAEAKGYRVFQVRWPVLEGVHGEGLFLEPNGKPRGWIVALPDAGQTPEQIAGLAPGVDAGSQFARRFVENGYSVIVPALIDRTDRGSGDPDIAMTNQPHREWIYRQAFMMGRHIIGYEVQKVLAAVDWIAKRGDGAPVGVAGYGEGGLIAFYSAAVDPHIRATLVSGYFRSRQQTWEEPLYRNVWGLLREFGDAEIATMIAPRGLVVEFSDEPKVDGPPVAGAGVLKCGAPGKLETPPLQEVESEFQRIDTLLPAGFQPRQLVKGTGEAPVIMGSQEAIAGFVTLLGADTTTPSSSELPVDRRRSFDPAARQLRQVKELEAHVQGLIRASGAVRDDFFLYKVQPRSRNEPWTRQLRFDQLPVEPVIEATKEYRKIFWEEVIGKLDEPLPPPNPRSRKIYDEPAWTGYEVVLDVGGEGFSWGILCVPKNLKPGEKRPVVVCQHGRHGLPKETVEGDTPYYRNFAARLAEQGFITFAPHNLYQKEAYYRILSRKGNTVKASMFSVILRHHEQILNWLGTLPFVDPQRISFYGLSYGGETAVRVPPLLSGYCLSICSGDFNDWPLKVASTNDRHSFMYTDEWEMPYFNMGNTFNYAELTYLMFPRPFMVERGHHDGVAPDQWVASEYAKTRRFYDQYGLGDKTRIEFFNGGHTINGQGTFEFLHQQLHWPNP